MREYGGWNVRVENQHFRIAGGNLKIRKITSLWVLAWLIACMVPVGIDYGLTSPSHATDKSTELMLRKLGPLLNESLSELPDSCWLDLERRNGFLQHIPCMFYRGSRWPIQSHNCSLLKVPVGDAGPMYTSIIIHHNEIRTYSTCIGRTWTSKISLTYLSASVCRYRWSAGPFSPER